MPTLNTFKNFQQRYLFLKFKPEDVYCFLKTHFWLMAVLIGVGPKLVPMIPGLRYVIGTSYASILK